MTTKRHLPYGITHFTYQPVA